VCGCVGACMGACVLVCPMCAQVCPVWVCALVCVVDWKRNNIPKKKAGHLSDLQQACLKTFFPVRACVCVCVSVHAD